MKIKHLYVATLVFLFLSANLVLAEDGKIWKDEAELSYVQTGGNTEITSLSAKNL